MKVIYKAKTIIDGFKIGFAGKKLVAIPLDKARPGAVIAHNNKIMVLKADPLRMINFPDKFGRGIYVLCYYEWQPGSVWNSD